MGEAVALQSCYENQDADADYGRRKRLERSSDRRRADVPKSETPRRAYCAGSLSRRIPRVFAADIYPRSLRALSALVRTLRKGRRRRNPRDSTQNRRLNLLAKPHLLNNVYLLYE